MLDVLGLVRRCLSQLNDRQADGLLAEVQRELQRVKDGSLCRGRHGGGAKVAACESSSDRRQLGHETGAAESTTSGQEKHRVWAPSHFFDLVDEYRDRI